MEKGLWLTTKDAAKMIGLHPNTLNVWRMWDARSGCGTTERPGRGGLVWRKFGHSVRYLVTSLTDCKVPRKATDDHLGRSLIATLLAGDPFGDSGPGAIVSGRVDGFTRDHDSIRPMIMILTTDGGEEVRVRILPFSLQELVYDSPIMKGDLVRIKYLGQNPDTLNHVVRIIVDEERFGDELEDTLGDGLDDRSYEMPDDALWITPHEAARRLGVAVGRLAKWRVEDMREGRGWPEPGRNGLRWRRFGHVVRYLA